MKIRHHAKRIIERSRKVFLRQAASGGKREQILSYLNQKLSEKDKSGEVLTIITYNSVERRFACFGERIKDGSIWSVMNGSTGHRVSYPNWERLRKWQHGLFIPLSAFEPGQAGWVALIGTAPPGESRHETIPFG